MTIRVRNKKIASNLLYFLKCEGFAPRPHQRPRAFGNHYGVRGPRPLAGSQGAEPLAIAKRFGAFVFLRLLWLLAIVFVPIVGAILYLLLQAGRDQYGRPLNLEGTADG